MQALGKAVKAAKGTGLARASESGDRGAVGVRIAGEVKAAAIVPPVPGQNGLWQKGQVVLQPLAIQGEEVIEDLPHRQDGWPRIDGPGG
jgi:hypothetical protein